MGRRIWTDDQLIEAVKTSKNKWEVIQKLGLKPPGGYRTLNKYLSILNVDTSHFETIEELQKRARQSVPRIPTELILVESSSFNYKTAKARVISENLIPLECYECKIGPTWNGKSLTLQLDHINGINNDHRLENLRLLCPNCHSQTDTFCGRNVATAGTKLVYYCQDSTCGKELTCKATYCRGCVLLHYVRPTKIQWPSDQELIRMVEQFNYRQVGRQLGVSDVAVKKHYLKALAR